MNIYSFICIYFYNNNLLDSNKVSVFFMLFIFMPNKLISPAADMFI